MPPRSSAANCSSSLQLCNDPNRPGMYLHSKFGCASISLESPRLPESGASAPLLGASLSLKFLTIFGAMILSESRNIKSRMPLPCPPPYLLGGHFVVQQVVDRLRTLSHSVDMLATVFGE